MTFKLEYLGEFKFIVENNLVEESGDQGRAFYEKTLVENLIQMYRFL